MEIYILFIFFHIGQNICIFFCACGKACFPCLQEHLVIFLPVSILKLTTLKLHELFRSLTELVVMWGIGNTAFTLTLFYPAIYTSYIHSPVHSIPTCMNTCNYTKAIAFSDDLHDMQCFLLRPSPTYARVCRRDKNARKLILNRVAAEPQSNSAAAFPAWGCASQSPGGLRTALSGQLGSGAFDAVLSSV